MNWVINVPARNINEYKEQLELITKLVGMCSTATAKALLNKAETSTDIFKLYLALCMECESAGIDLNEPNTHIGIIRDE